MWGDYTEVRPYKSKNGIKNLPFNQSKLVEKECIWIMIFKSE